MLKRETAIRQLILNGYDDSLATQLPKLFIADFLDKEQEKLSEALDIFIDYVQRGYISPDTDDNIIFGSIQKMGEEDMDTNSVDGIFYNFRSHITEEFTRIVKRQPLQDILLEGGAMKFHPELAYASNDPVYFEKEIVGSPEEYSDLCVVSPMHGVSSNSSYIKAQDLYSLLLSKGFNEESIAIIFGEYGMEPRYPKTVPNDGIYLRHDDVVNLGAGNLKTILKPYVKDYIKR